MKLADWPNADRHLWLQATTPADPFAEDGGTRANHRPSSNRFVETGYGRWLTFLARAGLLTPDDPADRINPETIRAYVHELGRLGNINSTILARLEALSEMAKVVGPRRSWSFIGRMASRVRARGSSSPAKGDLSPVDSSELLTLGLDLMERAGDPSPPLRSATTFRDGLMIALLALRPLRRQNLADLTLGRSLLRMATGWLMSIPPSETKTHVTLEFAWPAELEHALETYLSIHRPFLVGRRGRWHRAIGDRLWVSIDGSPLTDDSIYWRISGRTNKAFGRPLSPHVFRNAAATTVAIHDPAHVRLAAPLLGHRTFNTTERHYIRASGLEAHRKFAQRIATLREQATADLE